MAAGACGPGEEVNRQYLGNPAPRTPGESSAIRRRNRSYQVFRSFYITIGPRCKSPILLRACCPQPLIASKSFDVHCSRIKFSDDRASRWKYHAHLELPGTYEAFLTQLVALRGIISAIIAAALSDRAIASYQIFRSTTFPRQCSTWRRNQNSNRRGWRCNRILS